MGINRTCHHDVPKDLPLKLSVALILRRQSQLLRRQQAREVVRVRRELTASRRVISKSTLTARTQAGLLIRLGDLELRRVRQGLQRSILHITRRLHAISDCISQPNLQQNGGRSLQRTHLARHGRRLRHGSGAHQRQRSCCRFLGTLADRRHRLRNT